MIHGRLPLALALPSLLGCAAAYPTEALECQVTRCEGPACPEDLRAFAVTFEGPRDAVIIHAGSSNGQRLRNFRSDDETVVSFGTDTPSWPISLTLRYGPDAIEAQYFSSVAGLTEFAVCNPREAL